MKVAFIGLGIMGSRMAGNILKSGQDLIVHNRTKSKADSLISAGAIWAESPAEATKSADIIITMLEDPKAVESVFNGENGISSAPPEGKLWLDCSTVNPSFTVRISEMAREKGFRFIDAPVAGSKAPAESGELVFLAGGDADDLKEATHLLEAMGKKTIHIGAVGQGAAMKIIVNLMLAQTMLAFSESSALGQSMGVSQELLFNVLLNTPVVPPYLAALRPKLEAENIEANFPLKLIRKDLQLVSETAYENNIAMPSASVAKEVYTNAMNNGLGDADFSAIYQYLNR